MADVVGVADAVGVADVVDVVDAVNAVEAASSVPTLFFVLIGTFGFDFFSIAD